MKLSFFFFSLMTLTVFKSTGQVYNILKLGWFDFFSRHDYAEVIGLGKEYQAGSMPSSSHYIRAT